MNITHELGPQGVLKAVLIQHPRNMPPTTAPLTWKMRNRMRGRWMWGWFCNLLARWFTKITSIKTITAELSAILIRADGTRIDFGILSYRLVTDSGVAFIVDDWDGNTTDITNFNFHGVGTTNTAESAGDTALAAESTTVINPDSTRATGTKSQPAANQARSVGVVNFDGSATIVEHGIFSQAATGGGTLLDRSVFAGIGVANGDSIQFTYTLTFNSGG